MARRQNTFKQQDVTRALRGAKAAGIKIQRLEIDKAGTIALFPSSGENLTLEDELDQELTAFEAMHGSTGDT